MSKITSSQIKNHNDLLRTTFFPYLGKVMLTSGVNDHPKKEEAITKVREFVDFTPDNDPHGEHDFGSFKIDGEEFFFKIDYFSDHTFEYGADPYDEQPVVRVLTILLASEY